MYTCNEYMYTNICVMYTYILLDVLYSVKMYACIDYTDYLKTFESNLISLSHLFNGQSDILLCTLFVISRTQKD